MKVEPQVCAQGASLGPDLSPGGHELAARAVGVAPWARERHRRWDKSPPSPPLMQLEAWRLTAGRATRVGSFCRNGQPREHVLPSLSAAFRPNDGLCFIGRATALSDWRLRAAVLAAEIGYLEQL